MKQTTTSFKDLAHDVLVNEFELVVTEITKAVNFGRGRIPKKLETKYEQLKRELLTRLS